MLARPDGCRWSGRAPNVEAFRRRTPKAIRLIGEMKRERLTRRSSPTAGDALPAAKVQPRATSPRISHPSGSADAVALAAVGVADGELVVGIGVEADIPVHVHAQATTQLQARGLLQ